MIMIFWCRSSRESVIQSLCYMLLLFLNFTHLVRRALVLSYTSFFMRYFHSKRESLDRPFLFYHENIYWYKPEKLLSLALMDFFTIIWTFAKCSSEFAFFLLFSDLLLKCVNGLYQQKENYYSYMKIFKDQQ